MSKEKLGSEEQWNELKANFAKWEQVGQMYQGVYVNKHLTEANPQYSKSKMQTIYTLIQDDGTELYIAGRGKNDPTILPGLESAKFGQYLRVQFTEEIKPKEKGLHPAKAIKVFSNGVSKMEILQEYRNRKAGVVNVAEDPDFKE